MAFIAASRLDAILDDTTLTHSQKLMLIVLLRHGGNGGIYPSLRRIAKLSSLALSTVCTLMTELTSIGRVTVHHGQAPKGGNLYELHLPGVPITGAPTTGAPVVGAPTTGAPSTGAPATGTEVQTEEKTLLPSRPPEHRPPEHRPSVHPSTITEAGAKWLRHKSDLDPTCEFYNALAGTPPSAQEESNDEQPPADTMTIPEPETLTVDPSPGEAASPPTVPPSPPRRRATGTAAYRLGKLCPRGHDYEGTGQSLRRMPSGSCKECDLEKQEEKRRAKVLHPRAHKPYARPEGPPPVRIIYSANDAPPRQRAYRPYQERLAAAASTQEGAEA